MREAFSRAYRAKAVELTWLQARQLDGLIGRLSPRSGRYSRGATDTWVLRIVDHAVPSRNSKLVKRS